MLIKYSIVIKSPSSSGFTALDIRCDMNELENFCEENKINTGEYLAVLLAVNDNMVTDVNLSVNTFYRMRNRFFRVNYDEYIAQAEIINGLFNDLKVFPVPESSNSNKWVSYVDSWGYERTYGGKRQHEGTDIMADVNIPGLYPIVSATDGVVVNMGWLELGGYRVTVQSDSGISYYYAHLDSYADNLTEGKNVKAGELLGFMGNSGYGTEGTKGKFDVHLHFGIYINYLDVEYAVNPYYFLKKLEKNRLYYQYDL